MPIDREAMQEILRRAQESIQKRNGHTTSSAEPAQPHQPVDPQPPPDPPPASLPTTYQDWRFKVGMVVKRTLDDVPENDRPTIASMKHDRLIDLIVKQAHEVVDARVPPWWPLPDGLSETEVAEELHKLAAQAVTLFREVYLPAQVPAIRELAVETFDAAIEANQRYLERVPVIENLLFSSACSMITGGKHSGKSTLARWEAVCVAKGYEFLGRKVRQGPVIYLASADEELVARTELIRLGWCAADPLFFVGQTQIPDDFDEKTVLNLLTDQIRKRSALLCVVDMLFDYIPVRDELGYAETRKAVGFLQRVASETGAHLTVLHHAPKHALPTADAAITALGSQGLAARVSPIILTRRYGPGVHAVVSTEVRDPRGKPIRDSRLLLQPDGALVLGEAFKNYMLAEIYAERVIEILQAEPGAEMTSPDVAEALDVKYEVARATLSFLYKNNLVTRTGEGRKGHPYRYAMPLPETVPTKQISPANEQSNFEYPTIPTSSGGKGNKSDAS